MTRSEQTKLIRFMNTLSVVISAFNEEAKIKDCLESVKGMSSEIVFVDNLSLDKTREIARKYTDKILTRKNNLMLNVNKNYGFSKATGDWILSLDADERVTPELKEEIRNVINNKATRTRHSGEERSDDSRIPKHDERFWASQNDEKRINGFWIPRKNIIFGKWIQHSIWWPDYQLRLFRRDKGRFPEKHVHEYIRVEGKTEKLQHPLEHLNYSTVSQFIYKMDKIYTESEVEKIIASGKILTWIDAIRFPVNDFLKTFFAEKGYKDGLHGLVLSILQSLYAEVVFAKVWERQGFKEENNPHFLKDIYKECKEIIREFHYWTITSFLETSYHPLKRLFYKTLRKFRKSV